MKAAITCKLVFFFFISGAGAAPGQSPVFSTWDDFEVDKLASIWLLKRFISPGATIEIYPKGQIIRRGMEFDTPYAPLGRRYNKSAFEVLVEHYRITDERLIALSRIIHDIEINVWQSKLFEESTQIEHDIWAMIESSRSDKALMEESFQYFDDLYENMNRLP